MHLIAKFLWQTYSTYYLSAFDLLNKEPGGAVGGRILILDVNGTRDALRNTYVTDGKSITGSHSSS